MLLPAGQPAPAPALYADFSVCRTDFQLNADLEIGTEILVLFGPSGPGKPRR